jgi:hypothetical protein
LCFACRTVHQRLHQPLAPVLPVSLCPLPGPLYSLLIGYKESPVAEVRRHSAALVDGLFTVFLRQHRRCVFEQLKGPPTLVLPVPSTSRPGPPPLDRAAGLRDHVPHALQFESNSQPLWCPDLLQRADAPVGHMAAHPGAFAVPPWAGPLVTGTRIALLDDTYVSGARSQSAAAALRQAGAHRVLIVPLGRVIRPDIIPEHDDFLRRSRKSRAAPHRCARCVVRQPGVAAGAPSE